MSEFKIKVIQIIKGIPQGKVMSYGQIAVYADSPRAARQVGWILNKSGDTLNLPWWRVVNNAGVITIRGSIYSPYVQKELLQSEGIIFTGEFSFDIEKYRYKIL